MFFNKEKKIQTITDENIVITEIYKKGGKTFQLFCDVVKSKGTIGINNNYCLKMLTSSGFALIVDSRQMLLPEVSIDEGKEVTLEKISQGFNNLKQFADIL